MKIIKKIMKIFKPEIKSGIVPKESKMLDFHKGEVIICRDKEGNIIHVIS